MRQKYVSFVVSQGPDGSIHVDGREETEQHGRPDVTVSVDDVVYGVYLISRNGSPLNPLMFKQAVRQLPKLLREPL